MNLKSKKGFTLVELLVVTAILAFMMGGIYMVMLTGRQSWSTSEIQIQLQDNLRQTIDRMSKELRETGADKNGNIQITISNGTGINNSDIVKFSIPITCQSNLGVVDANGDVAYWGAPLTWGCTSSACMDANNDCTALDYKYIEYKIDSSNRLLRRVLSDVNAQARQDIFAFNITDLQASLSVDQKIVTITATGTARTAFNRTITFTSSMDIYLRNKG